MHLIPGRSSNIEIRPLPKPPKLLGHNPTSPLTDAPSASTGLGYSTGTNSARMHAPWSSEGNCLGQ